MERKTLVGPLQAPESGGAETTGGRERRRCRPGRAGGRSRRSVSFAPLARREQDLEQREQHEQHELEALEVRKHLRALRQGLRLTASSSSSSLLAPQTRREVAESLPESCLWPSPPFSGALQSGRKP